MRVFHVGNGVREGGADEEWAMSGPLDHYDRDLENAREHAENPNPDDEDTGVQCREHGYPTDDCPRCDEDRADADSAAARQKRIDDADARGDALYEQSKDERGTK